jgi:hypothetical protein
MTHLPCNAVMAHPRFSLLQPGKVVDAGLRWHDGVGAGRRASLSAVWYEAAKAMESRHFLPWDAAAAVGWLRGEKMPT